LTVFTTSERLLELRGASADERIISMARSPENFPNEQRGEQKPKETRPVDPKTARKLGQTAIKGAKK
jgi:hypothetical protein